MTVSNASRRAPVMKDVAHAAGVSHQTVSRVLNNHPSVSPHARERVEQAIATLGYRRNVAARSLVTRQSRTIGVLATELGQYGPSHTLLGLESAARDAGYYVSISILREVNDYSVKEAINGLADQAVDGIAVVVPHPEIMEVLNGLDQPFPIVAATSGTGGHLGGASVNQRLGARLAVQHLIKLGHTRIGHLSGPQGWYDASERIIGWQEAMRDAGLTPDTLIQGNWTAEGGYLVGQTIGRSASVTAFFIANDQMALGFLRGLHETGLKVPGDLSIVGYDNQPEAAYFYPPLTTINQDFEELGRRCIGALLDQLDRQDGAGRRLVEPRLVIRATTGPPRK